MRQKKAHGWGTGILCAGEKCNRRSFDSLRSLRMTAFLLISGGAVPRIRRGGRTRPFQNTRWMGVPLIVSSHPFRQSVALPAEEVFGFLDDYVAADIGDSVGEGICLGRCRRSSGEAALLDAAVGCHGRGRRSSLDFAGGVDCEELDLAMVAAPQSRCPRDCGQHPCSSSRRCSWRGVSGFLLLGKARGPSRVIGCRRPEPSLDGHQVFREHRAVTWRSPDQGELGERLDADGLLEIVDQGGAGHAGFALMRMAQGRRFPPCNCNRR